MKYIVIGLGQLGAVLAQRLTGMGHEVIGVDSNKERVEELKDSISTTICLDVQTPMSIDVIPLASADAVFVTISDDFGASIYTAALLKQRGVKRIIARATSLLQRSVLEALGITELLTPESDYAEALAARFELTGSNNAMILTDDYVIMEVSAPDVFTGQQIDGIGFEENFSLRPIAVKRIVNEKIAGISRHITKVLSQWQRDTVIEAGDTLILFGRVNDFQKLKQL